MADNEYYIDTKYPGKMQWFETGANRSDSKGKIDFEGFVSPLALEAYGNYMLKHQTQADGKLRESDNWQKGIPEQNYMKSMWRHFFDVWKLYRGYKVVEKGTGREINMQEALTALFFNVQGMLHERVKRDGFTI